MGEKITKCGVCSQPYVIATTAFLRHTSIQDPRKARRWWNGCIYSVFHFYVTFCRHFRTRFAPEKNKNYLKYNKNKNWQRGRRWPPEPRVGGSSPSWRTSVTSLKTIRRTRRINHWEGPPITQNRAVYSRKYCQNIAKIFRPFFNS